MTSFLNDRAEELSKQLVTQQELYYQVLHQKALDDLFIFNRYVLGVENGKDGVKLAPFHKELCHFVSDNTKKKKLILIPRGHLKSTLITIGYSVQQIVKNPNIRILILNATWQMSVDFLTEIKRHLTSNEEILKMYGQLGENPEEWSQDRITLRRSDMGIKGPTVWATGIDSNLVGSHPDMIIFDDVVNRDNTSSRDQVEKVILRYKDALDLLEPGGQLIIIGTRWNETDLYSWLMDKDNNISSSYDIQIKKAYTGDLLSGNDFQALWPEKFSLSELQTRLREKGWYEFSAQYRNDPIPSEDSDFKRNWFRYYDLEEYKAANMRTVISVDPAISLEKEADYTAMVTVGIDQFTNIFIKDIVRKKMKPNEIIDSLFYLNELWHPQMIILETVAYQKALAYAIRDAMNQRRRFLPIVEIKQQDKSKDQRIRGLQPLYMNTKIYHRKEHLITPYFEEELLTFPRGKHDDMIDALSMALDYLIAPKVQKKRFQHTFLY